MIPGWIAGEYERSELVLDVRLMAERVAARLIIGEVVGIDVESRTLVLADGSRQAYDIASLDVGSTVRGLGESESVSESGGPNTGTVVSAREPGKLVTRLETVGDGPVVIVGGGAAGVELAACVRSGADGPVTLLESGERVMNGYDPSVSRRVRRELGERSISVRLNATVHKMGAEGLLLQGGEGLPSVLTVWATGPRGRPFLGESGLPVVDGGFVLVHDDLRVVGRDDLFAAGDCASSARHPAPKAGLHAIRQGELLADNLGAAIESWPARPAALGGYEPQSDFLTLLNLGDGRALGTKWGYTLEGRWVRGLKDVIDRRFVERFQS